MVASRGVITYKVTEEKGRKVIVNEREWMGKVLFVCNFYFLNFHSIFSFFTLLLVCIYPHISSGRKNRGEKVPPGKRDTGGVQVKGLHRISTR